MTAVPQVEEPPLISAATTLTARRSRFSPDVSAALEQAGWRSGRWEIRQAEEWADTIASHGAREIGLAGHRHSVFPAAIEAWAEFGGLTFELSGAGTQLARTPFVLNPLCGLHQPRTLADFGRALDTSLAPLGEEMHGQALLTIDETGRVYSLDHTGEWFLGHNVEQAIGTLVAGTAPERLRAGGTRW